MAKAAKKTNSKPLSVQEPVDVVVEGGESPTMLALKALPAGMNKSQKIRALAAAGHERADIARAMGIIYQHVRNVLNTPLKRVSAESKAE